MKCENCRYFVREDNNCGALECYGIDCPPLPCEKGAKMEEIKRDCENCKHYVCGDDGYYSCEKWNCEFESKEENTDEDSN